MGMLISKLPLIVIVPHKSCIVYRQIGAEESKYGVTRDPLFTGLEGGHVTYFSNFGTPPFLWNVLS